MSAHDANKRYVATQIPEPPIAQFFFADTRMAWFWLIVRLLVGSGWLAAGVSKVTGYAFGTRANGSPWWFMADDGAALKSFANNVQPRPACPATRSRRSNGGCVRRPCVA
jgi:thiosulfate dehydrogenase (quinone) large subunit